MSCVGRETLGCSGEGRAAGSRMEGEQEQGRVPVGSDRAGHSTLLSWEAAGAPSQLLGTHRVLCVLGMD